MAGSLRMPTMRVKNNLTRCKSRVLLFFLRFIQTKTNLRFIMLNLGNILQRNICAHIAWGINLAISWSHISMSLLLILMELHIITNLIHRNVLCEKYEYVLILRDRESMSTSRRDRRVVPLGLEGVWLVG